MGYLINIVQQNFALTKHPASLRSAICGDEAEYMCFCVISKFETKYGRLNIIATRVIRVESNCSSRHMGMSRHEGRT